MDDIGELIAVVEDDAGMRQALYRLLLASSYRARVFESAEALLAVDGARDATCLVLDVHLTGLSGPGLYTRLGSELGASRPPAVFITAHDSPASRQEVVLCGGGAVLLKPFPGHELLAAIARAVHP